MDAKRTNLAIGVGGLENMPIRAFARMDSVADAPNDDL